MMVQPLQVRLSAVNAVVEQLRNWIVDDAFGEGAALPPERELAAQLCVSRPTLRQALAILAQMGLVTSRRGRNGGIRVSKPTDTIIASSVTLLCRAHGMTAGQLIEVRRGIEVEAARLAAIRCTSADVLRIEEALDRYLQTASDPVLSNQHGRQLHYAIARATQNPLLVAMLRSLDPAFAEFVHLLWAVVGSRDEVERTHRPVVEAIASGNAEAAQRAMVQHFQQIEIALTTHLWWNRPLDEPIKATEVSIAQVSSPGREAAHLPTD